MLVIRCFDLCTIPVHLVRTYILGTRYVRTGGYASHQVFRSVYCCLCLSLLIVPQYELAGTTTTCGIMANRVVGEGIYYNTNTMGKKIDIRNSQIGTSSFKYTAASVLRTAVNICRIVWLHATPILAYPCVRWVRLGGKNGSILRSSATIAPRLEAAVHPVGFRSAAPSRAAAFCR